MQQIVIPKFGDPSVMELREVADPAPGPGEVRVRVEASGVNFADLMARMGIYPDAPPLPMVVGYEVAGTIDAVGDGVDAGRVGQQVVALSKFGGYATAICVTEQQAVVRPVGMDAVVAASIPVQGLAAWMMLEEFGRVRPGDRVLVHSAGGGVGLMALDLIKRRGAYAIGTASAAKHDMLRERGYDQLIDYRTEDYVEVLRGGEGLDLVLDPLGGENWKKGLSLLRPGGQLVCFGFSQGATGNRRSLLSMARSFLAVPWLKVNPVWLMNNNVGVCGVNIAHLSDEAPRVLGWLADLMALWEAGTLRPVVHATVPFSQAAEAHRILHDRENIGKVVLVPDA